MCYRVPSGQYVTLPGPGATDSEVEDCPPGTFSAWDANTTMPYWTGLDALEGLATDDPTVSRTPGNITECEY